MRRSTLVVFACLVAIPAAFYGTHRLCQSRDCDEQTWLKREFALSDEQLSRIADIQKQYEPICADHCRQIDQVRHRLHELARTGKKDSPEYASTVQEWQNVTRLCRTSTRTHIEAIAAIMSPEQAERYRAAVLPVLEQPAPVTPSQL